MDRLTKQERSRLMASVRSKNTEPELIVRRLVHGMGFRYRLHVPDLPGRPDLVFRGRMKVIFVHGCFWHQHECPHGKQMPKTNRAFWSRKLQGNKQRDRQHQHDLEALGYDVLTVWECKTSPARLTALKKELSAFLSD